MLEVHSDHCCCSDCASPGQLQNQVFEVDPVIPPLADADTLKVKNVEILIATSRDDTITGSSAQDWIDGGAGNDVINGGAGADTLIGGAGSDQLNGGDGADIADLSGGGGAVLADLSLTTHWKIGANGWKSGSLSDYTHYRVTDSFGAFDYLGLVEGLKGGSEADTLTGNAQNNTLSGGAGNDTLNSGGEADIFVNYKFSSRTVAGSEDVITDFLDGTDLIGLEKAHSGSTAVTFSDLTLTSVTRQDGGTDTRITAVSKYLWLVENTAPADFSVADFIAVGLASDGFA